MIRRIVFSCLIAFTSALASSDAVACWNATQAELDTQVRTTIAAQRALDDENPRLAIRLIEQVPHATEWLMLGSVWPNGGTRWTYDAHSRGRMMRIYALAVARSQRPTQQEIGRAKRARENVYELIDGSESPSRRADFAEFDAFAGQTEDALKVLRELAARDLIGSAHAYATLARLERAQGNADASNEALARCNNYARASKRASICVVP
jgi:hypothetical protein